MKRFITAMTAALMLALIATTAMAAPPTKNTLTCSAVPATNCTTDGKTATFTNVGGAAAVYLTNYNGKNFYDKKTSLITTLSNTVGGSALGIDPRWSIPIDTGHDGDTNFFAFVAFGSCNNGTGLVDVIHDATCTIERDGVSFPNWAAMVAAHPNDYISFADYAFIIADGSGAPGEWTVSNVKVGKPGTK